MGWIHCTKPAGISAVDFIAAELAPVAPEIVARGHSPGASYFALRMTAEFDPQDLDVYVPAADGSVTVALVVLYDDLGTAFNYKALMETVGPLDGGGCPKAVLDVLSPLRPDAPGYAARWRARQKAASALETPATA